MTTNISFRSSNDGEPIAEIHAEGFQVCLHIDSRSGILIVLDDLELYRVDGLNDESLRATITAATWARLKALVASGVVDQLLQQA